MRIVELVDSLDVGGTERLVVALSLRLHSLGNQISVVCLRKSGPLEAELSGTSIRVHQLRKGDGPSLRTVFELAALLRREKVEVIHSHNPLVHHYAVAAAKLARVPVIVNTIHGPGNLAEKAGGKEFLYAISCRMSSRVFAVCESACQVFLRRNVIPLKKLSVVDNGIDVAGYASSTQQEERSRDFVYGCVARLAAVKDHRSLLLAFKRVRNVVPGCRLELLGDGPERAKLESTARSLELQDHITFHGYGANVPAFLRSVDVFVLTSLSEGLSLSILEAMASGLPIIATDVGENKKLVESAAAGWLCAPSDIDAISAAMIDVAKLPTDERIAIGQRARLFVGERYSLEGMARDYLRHFAELKNA